MRYRPFANSGTSVSAVSLGLTDDDGMSEEAWSRLAYAALEAGVNCFEVQGRGPSMVKGVARSLSEIERRLLFVAWRIGPRTIPAQYAERAFQPDMVAASIQSALARSGLGYLDLVLLDDPGEQDLPPQSLAVLKDAKAKGLIRAIGVAGQDEAIDAYISTGAFDALALPFSMASGWRERHRLRAAQQRNMAVIGYDYCPPTVLRPQTETVERRGLFRRRKVVAVEQNPYAFLHHTHGWAAEEICLAYALTEPSIATVQVSADTVERVEVLAEAAEREMPAGLAAQIEMARIGAERQSG